MVLPNVIETEYWARNKDMNSSNGASLRVCANYFEEDEYAVFWTGSDLINDLINNSNMIDGGYEPQLQLTSWDTLENAIQDLNHLSEKEVDDMFTMVVNYWNYTQN
jgi:hypothetical protein